MHSSFKLTALVAITLLTACDDLTLYRAGGDYFPLTAGTSWTYSSGTATYVDSVAGDSTIADRRAIVVLRSFAPEFWVKGSADVWRHVRRTAMRNGRQHEVEARFALEYALPFVLGSTWSQVFRDTVVIDGTETLYVRDSSAGRVAGIENVATPAGEFIECYRIELFRSVRTDTLTESRWTEWLAPGVGLVKRRTPSDSIVLIEFRSPR